uniref:Polysaccharide pyruvyl transferase domain-containing protein n=1 Tax=viral metagenome TaxID=1070528 RepID=A0A6C0DC33_9ZZZZ
MLMMNNIYIIYMSNTLVIVLCETRAHELTFENFKKNVIDELNADLCICIGIKNDYNYDNPYYNLAKYKFLYNEPNDYSEAFEYAYKILCENRDKYEKLENINTLYGKIKNPGQSINNIKYYGICNNNNINNVKNFDIFNDDEIIIHTKDFPNKFWKNHVYGVKKSDNNFVYQKDVITYKKPLYWREFLKIKNQIFGGIKDKQNEHPGSGGILIFFRWFLLKNLIENDLINKYDRFVITRSDFIYQLPHPKIEFMSDKYIWIPNCEQYGGYTDRHVVLSKNNIEQYLNILNNLVIRSNEYFMKMKNKNDWNMEKLIKFHLNENKILHLVKEFPYIMYSVRNINGTTRWKHGNYSKELGYYIKYDTEYKISTYYKKIFEQSNSTIDKFYSNLNKRYVNMLYFIPYKSNFGDELNVYIINKLIDVLNLNIHINYINLSINKNFNNRLKTFSFLGSIMHSLPPNIDVIGTGVNPNHPNINKNLNILALRGKLSKDYLINKKGYKIGNIVMGDPALLIPRLFPEWLEPLENNSNNNIGLIPHFNDIDHVNKYKKIINELNIDCCYPNQPAINVINFIRSKDIIISSSLHGIIVAEMLGKKTKWIMYNGSLKSESKFKYLEYYNSTNRYNINPTTNIKEALEMEIPDPEYNDVELFNLIKNYLESD